MSSPLQGATGFSLAFNSGAFATHGSNINTLTTAAINFCINGRLYQKAISNNIPWVIEPNSGLDPRAANSFQTVAAGKACAFLFVTDAVETANTNIWQIQGPIVDVGNSCPLPAVPAGKVAFAALKVSNASYATNGGYRPGTDAHNTGGLTRTFFNLTGHVDSV